MCACGQYVRILHLYVYAMFYAVFTYSYDNQTLLPIGVGNQSTLYQGIRL